MAVLRTLWSVLFCLVAVMAKSYEIFNSSYFEGPFKIRENNKIGNVYIADIIELSFELKLNEHYPSEALLKIGDSNGHRCDQPAPTQSPTSMSICCF